HTTLITIFHFIIPPRPNPPPFPYTTLFRSRHCAARTGQPDEKRGGETETKKADERRHELLPRSDAVTQPMFRNGVRTRQQLMPPDRKSTRLNSSHVAISYAVFCLKKKNKKT